MNTLSPTITARFFTDLDSRATFAMQWRTLMRSDERHQLTPAHHLLYLALMGKDWRKGFTPPRNASKIVNGAFTGWALFRAIMTIHDPRQEEQLLAPFGGLVSLAALEQMRSLIVRTSAFGHTLEEFADSTFPFDAYQLSEVPDSSATTRANG